MTLGLFDNPFGENKSAVLSDDGAYRFRLTRRWGSRPSVVFVMLNPSIADATIDDPTVRRCIGFARDWGFGALDVVNLFPWRATDPRSLVDAMQLHDVVRREERDHHIREALAESPAPPVAAWGAHWMAPVATGAVMALAPRWDCLGLTKSGSPKHPLYLAASTQRRAWTETPPDPWPAEGDR